MLPSIDVHVVSGKLFNITHPRQDEIYIDDIAYHLAMQCRFNGAVKDFRFYSVAEHCFWGSFIVKAGNELAFLLHDAQEAYIADMIRPIKRHDAFFNELEENLEPQIRRRFGQESFPQHVWDDVKGADNYMGYVEAQELLVRGYSDAGRAVPQYSPRIVLKAEAFGRMTPRMAHCAFMRRFDELTS